VSRRTRVRAMLVRPPNERARWWVLSYPRRPVAETVQLSFDSVVQYRPIARREAENNAKHWDTRFTRSLLLQPEAWQTAGHDSMAVWLHRHPYIGALQTSVYLERQFSRIFPAHPRSLASVLIPRPAARRVSASHCVRPAGFGFRKILCATNAKRFSESSEKDAAWPWERGTLASLRARVSRG
jgi:hypothetical protein